MSINKVLLTTKSELKKGKQPNYYRLNGFGL